MFSNISSYQPSQVSGGNQEMSQNALTNMQLQSHLGLVNTQSATLLSPSMLPSSQSNITSNVMELHEPMNANEMRDIVPKLPTSEIAERHLNSSNDNVISPNNTNNSNNNSNLINNSNYYGSIKGLVSYENTLPRSSDLISRDNKQVMQANIEYQRNRVEGMSSSPYFVGSKLFVGQVPAVCTEEQLRPIFAEFGPLLEVKIMREHNGRSKGSAWVRYEDQISAEKAIAALNEKYVVPPQTNPLRVQFATPNTLRGPRINASNSVGNMNSMNNNNISYNNNFGRYFTSMPATQSYKQPNVMMNRYINQSNMSTNINNNNNSSSNNNSYLASNYVNQLPNTQSLGFGGQLDKPRGTPNASSYSNTVLSYQLSANNPNVIKSTGALQNNPATTGPYSSSFNNPAPQQTPKFNYAGNVVQPVNPSFVKPLNSPQYSSQLAPSVNAVVDNSRVSNYPIASISTNQGTSSPSSVSIQSGALPRSNSQLNTSNAQLASQTAMYTTEPLTSINATMFSQNQVDKWQNNRS